MADKITQKEIDTLLNGVDEKNEELEKMGFTDSLENNISLVDDFITNLEAGLKAQDNSVQKLLDELEKIPPEAKEKILEKENNVIKQAKELKDISFEIYSFCVKTKEAFNNKKPEFKTNKDLCSYMILEFLPAIEKIQEMNGGK